MLDREEAIAKYAKRGFLRSSGLIAPPHEAESSLVPKGCGTRGGDQPA